MQRSMRMVAAVAIGAAAFGVGGCERQEVNTPERFGLRSDVGTLKPTEPYREEALEKSAAAGQLDAPVLSAVRDDAAITAVVSSALREDPSLKSADIQVDTKDGMVTLSGNVDTLSLRLLAKEVAARQPGVVGIVDNISVPTQA